MLETAFRLAKSLIPAPVKTQMERLYIWALPHLPLQARISVNYFKSFRRFPDLRNPRTFNEKMQVLKLAEPDLSAYVDKVLAKRFVADRVGAAHIIPTLYSGEALPPCEERVWPLPFVIKTNHSSGGNIFVRDTPDWGVIEAHLAKLLAYDFGVLAGETYYLKIKRQVLVEPLIGSGELPVDYKIFTFGGVPEFIQVDTEREHNHKRGMFDTNWLPLDVRLKYPPCGPVTKPSQLTRMLEIAAKIGSDFNFVRVDLYEVDGEIYFGEMGFTPEGGLAPFDPPHFDEYLGYKWAWPDPLLK